MTETNERLSSKQKDEHASPMIGIQFQNHKCILRTVLFLCMIITRFVSFDWSWYSQETYMNLTNPLQFRCDFNKKICFSWSKSALFRPPPPFPIFISTDERSSIALVTLLGYVWVKS